MMSASVPAIHKRPNRPTELTCIRLTGAAFSASFAARLMYAAGAHSSTSIVCPGTSIIPRVKRFNSWA